MSIITLTFVATCELWWEAFGSTSSYTVNLAAVAVVAVGCTGKHYVRYDFLCLHFSGTKALAKIHGQ